jgi:2-amino-4-hydroxy-6-hydroxymethyldihydropteridine diphosphokinase
VPILSLSIGSNIDAASNIRHALRELRGKFGSLECSSVYESEAVGFEGDNFLNLVAALETATPLVEICAYLKALEDSLGRDRSKPRFASRIIDIDILTYGDDDGSACDIELPRPEILRNAFVLRPLAELLPLQAHAEQARNFAQLWSDFDQSSQRLWPIEFDWQGVLA